MDVYRRENLYYTIFMDYTDYCILQCRGIAIRTSPDGAGFEGGLCRISKNVTSSIESETEFFPFSPKSSRIDSEDSRGFLVIGG